MAFSLYFDFPFLSLCSHCWGWQVLVPTQFLSHMKKNGLCFPFASYPLHQAGRSACLCSLISEDIKTFQSNAAQSLRMRLSSWGMRPDISLTFHPTSVAGIVQRSIIEFTDFSVKNLHSLFIQFTLTLLPFSQFFLLTIFCSTLNYVKVI